MSDITIFGAGGRAGRAVTAEARARGHQVTAVVRDPARYGALETDGVRVVRGDITDRHTASALVRGHDAVVHAVSPFSGPEQGFAGLDPEFFVKAADALLRGMATTGVPRLLVIGLGGQTVPPATARLSYADLAMAVVDEIESPRHHRTRVSVFSGPVRGRPE